ALDRSHLARFGWADVAGSEVRQLWGRGLLCRSLAAGGERSVNTTTWPTCQNGVRGEIVRVGASLFQRGFVHSTAGNISVRLAANQGGGFLITPSDACLGFLDPGELAWVDASGPQRSGAPASKTLALHRRIYSSTDDAHCVLHTHASHLVALTLQGVWREDDILPPLTAYQVMKVGHVPLIPYRRPGDPSVADAVAAHIEASK